MPTATGAIAEALAGTVGIPAGRIEPLLEIPPEESLGDYAFPCFALAKSRRASPASIASELASSFRPAGPVARVHAAGPYLNLFVDRPAFARGVLAEIRRQGARYGGSGSGRGKTVVLDYSSPNIAKTFAIHHLRSTVIGNALANLHEAAGWRTVRINHLGDWGTQFGTLLAAFGKWGDRGLLAGPHPVRHLMDLYVRFNKEKASVPALMDEARAAFAALEKGDPGKRALWQAFRDASLQEFRAIYDRLRIRFDETTGESAYAPGSPDLVAWLSSKGLVKESEGALIVDLEASRMPPCLLRKGDEASLYATRDLAAARDRYERFHFDRMLYVVGMPQELHFRQLFKVLELAGCDWHGRCAHVPFGHYQGMHTREGAFVLLADVLEEAVKRTTAKIRDGIREGLVDIPEAEIPTTAETVGVGAVMFNDLKTRRIKDIVFDWDDLLNFQGRTGPYVQYAHARICGILRKLGQIVEFSPEEHDAGPLTHDAELRLLKHVAEFPRQVERAVQDSEPSYVATALLELCKAFSGFYEQCSVIGVQTQLELFTARVRLIKATGLVIRNGLRLLGIQAPEKM